MTPARHFSFALGRTVDGARFDLFIGQVKALPAVYPVNAYPVRVRDGVVEIDLGVKTRELEIG